MVSLAMLMSEVLPHGPPQRVLAEEGLPVEAFGLEAAEEPFLVRVPIGTAGGSRTGITPDARSVRRTVVENFQVLRNVMHTLHYPTGTEGNRSKRGESETPILPLKSPLCLSGAFSAQTSSSGGGIRTPDTRIMIPLL